MKLNVPLSSVNKSHATREPGSRAVLQNYWHSVSSLEEARSRVFALDACCNTETRRHALLDWHISPAVPSGHMQTDASAPTAAHLPPLRHLRFVQAAELHSTAH
jgi:hypothetical protein